MDANSFLENPDHGSERDATIEAIVGTPPHAKYERLIAKAKELAAVRTIVVHPCEEGALRGPIEAVEAGIIIPVLVGPAAKISAVARQHHIDIDGVESLTCRTARRQQQKRSS